MPRELFSVRTSASAPRAGRGWLPVSLAVHGAAIVAILAAPLLADAVFPPPHAPADVALITVLPQPPELPRVAPAPSRGGQSAGPARPVSTALPPVDAPSALPDAAMEGFEIGPVGPPVQLGSAIGIPGGAGGGEAGPPVEAPQPSGPRRLSSGIAPPVKVKDARPLYPALAVRAHVEGTVVIDAVIGVDGRVTSTRVLQSVPLLDRAAMDAVARWRFTPARLNGEPVAVVMTVTVRFSLE